MMLIHEIHEFSEMKNLQILFVTFVGGKCTVLRKYIQTFGPAPEVYDH